MELIRQLRERGVRVRLLFDDLNTMLRTMTSPELRDALLVRSTADAMRLHATGVTAHIVTLDGTVFLPKLLVGMQTFADGCLGGS